MCILEHVLYSNRMVGLLCCTNPSLICLDVFVVNGMYVCFVSEVRRCAGLKVNFASVLFLKAIDYLLYFDEVVELKTFGSYCRGSCAV